MALSSSSSPNPPSSSATATATATPTPRLTSNPVPPSLNKTPIHPNFSGVTSHPSHRPQGPQPHYGYVNIGPRVPQLIKPHDPPPAAAQGVVHPLVSSGRGFPPKPVTATATATTDPILGGFRPRPGPYAIHSARVTYGARSNPLQHLIRPTNLQQQSLGSTGSVAKGIQVPSHPKAPPPPPPSAMPDGNGYKDTRAKDDNVFTVFDRKVRVSEGASLYAQCRSWLRNGVHEEPQPQFGDAVRTLPRPLPMPVAEEKKEAEADKEEEDEVNVDELSLKDLLKMHVTRAKKVRASLREERLQRIGRYKNRLALLLPPVGDQQPRKDSTSGNETPRTT